MSGMTSAYIRLLVLAGLIAGLAGCVSGGEESSATSDLVIEGTASKGPMADASISLYRVDINGRKKGNRPDFTTRTDSHGRWRLTVPGAERDNMFLVQAGGGTYVDESDPAPGVGNKRKISLSDGETLEGILFPGSDAAVITVQTTAMIRAARLDLAGMTSNGRVYTFEDAIREQQERSMEAFGFDVFTSQPADPLAPSGSTEQYWHAMLLGGMAYAMNNAAVQAGKPMMDYSVIDALANDLSDCRVNGLGRDGNPVRMPDGSVMPANIDLDREIRRFVNNNRTLYEDVPPFSIVYPSLCRLWIPIDSDGDGASDNFEKAIGTDIHSEDTDGDGYTDLREILGGSDPLSADSVPPATEIGTVGQDVALSDDTVWSRYGSPYWVRSNVSVRAGLKIEPGVIVKFDPGTGLDVTASGHLDVAGTTNAPVSFTSVHDDSIGGDAGQDGDAVTASAGDWRGVRFLAGSGIDRLDYLGIYYAVIGFEMDGTGAVQPLVGLNIHNSSDSGLQVGGNAAGNNPVFESLVVDGISGTAAVHITGATEPRFTGAGLIQGVAADSDAVVVDSGASARIAGMAIDGGRHGLRVVGRASVGFENGIIRGAQLNAVSAATAGTVEITGSLIAGSKWSGIATNSTGSLVLMHNRIVNNGGSVVQGGGVSVLNTGAGTVIKHNLIRGNSAFIGGGLLLGVNINRNATVEVYNNLIVQNSAGYAGGGVAIEWSAPRTMHTSLRDGLSAVFQHNTMTENETHSSGMGGGLYLGNSAVAGVYDSVISGNFDTNGISEVRVQNPNGLYQAYNFVGDSSLNAVGGAGRMIAADDFDQNWYLAPYSSAVDNGSFSAADIPQYLLELAAATTSSQGGADGSAGDVIDPGYHHDNISMSTEGVKLSLLEPGSEFLVNLGDMVRIVVIPRSLDDKNLGAGMDIDVAARLGLRGWSATDLGDGTYLVEYQAGQSSGMELLDVYVNGFGKSMGSPAKTITIRW